jgi:hypothetical protein
MQVGIRKGLAIFLAPLAAFAVSVFPAAANVDVVHTDSLGCEWAGASSISGNNGSSQTTNWNGSSCLYSVGVYLDSFCDWAGCWGYSWNWQSGNWTATYTNGDCSLGCTEHAYHQVTAPGVPGSQVIQTSTY